MSAIIDSSAWVALATCKALDFLHPLFGQIYVPQAVYDEVITAGKPQANVLRDFLANMVVPVDMTTLILTTGSLGRGELEAMGLYKQSQAKFLVIDDRRARLVAEANHIRCVGSLWVLLQAKQQGLIPEIAPFIARLRQAPLYFSNQLLDTILDYAHEL